jgi:hypothetical protein
VRVPGQGRCWVCNTRKGILKLRALAGNGDFDDYFDFHLRQQKQRDHDSRYQQAQALAA